MVVNETVLRNPLQLWNNVHIFDEAGSKNAFHWMHLSHKI